MNPSRRQRVFGAFELSLLLAILLAQSLFVLSVVAPTASVIS